MMFYDVAIVGAGPAGTMTAKHLALRGLSTVILEEHKAIGFPVQCAGLLGKKALSSCEVSERCVLKKITGANIFGPEGEKLSMGGGEVRAYVVDRRILDTEMAKNAIEAGSDILLNFHVSSIKKHDDHFVIHGTRENVRAKMVVLAEGVCGRLARMFGMGGFEKVITCAQIETNYSFLDEDFVEVFLGDWSPGFFVWAIPLGDDLGRVGLGVNPELSPPHPIEHLQNFLSNHPALDGRCRGNVMGLTVGAIPIGLKGRSYAEGVVAVGDAVAQVKPISGGGVYLGTLCGRIAAQTIAEALENGDTSAKRLSSYERAWKKEIGRELKFGMKVHNRIFTMKDEKISEILKLLDDEKILSVVNAYGDIDSPFSLAKRLLKELDFNILRMIKFLIR